jgi:carboxy-terminal domain RNA polymerase II polypeptide A small phosphatase
LVEANTNNAATAASNTTQPSQDVSGLPRDDGQPSASTNDLNDGTKNKRGLLHVPSRSSSHKIQPSPTSTGLSGATASDPTGSIGRRSKESKGSILGRRRTGSVASSKRSITGPDLRQGPTGRVDIANSQSLPLKKPKKNRSLLGFLNCCGVPDDANGDTPLPVKKVSKVPSQAPPATSSKPTSTLEPSGNQSAVPLLEKETTRHTESKQDPAVGLDESPQSPPGSRQDNGSLSRKPSSKEPQNQQNSQTEPQDVEKPAMEQESFNQTLVVQSPITSPSSRDSTGLGSTPIQGQDEAPKSITMNNDPAISVIGASDDERRSSTPILPPPPPIQASDPNRNATSALQDSTAIDSVEEKQQWLLPPIEPRFHGKKCLVLDLDETLVHSSFKVQNMHTDSTCSS